MLITLAELELHRIVISKTYDSGTLDYRGAEVHQASPLKVDAVAELVDSEVRIQGHLETRLSAFCDRCLAPLELPVDRHFDVFYRPVESIARDEEIEVPKDELGVGFYAGDGVELADVVTDQVILSVPITIVCRAECRGLCPVCGTDLNREECHCPPPRTESPFARLK